MNTFSIKHSRSARIIAGAAFVAAVAAGTTAVALANDSGQPAAPAPSSHTSVDRSAGHAFPYQPTTSGGRVMTGQ